MKYVTASLNKDLDELLDLICRNIQLDQTRYDKATSTYESIGKWLAAEDSPIRHYYPAIFPQGSLALDTTCRPLRHTEFDLDVVCLVRVPPSVAPNDVFEFVCQRIFAHGTYAKMARRMDRCIRLDYAGDYHLDVVPAIPDPSCKPGETCLFIPDRPRKVWLPSNPQGYVMWYDEQAKKRILLEKFSVKANMAPLREPVPFYSKPVLKLATQLLKRWRDVAFEDRGNLQPSSIILTTLAGHLYGGEDHPTDALMAILDGILELASQGTIQLQNPSNPKEWITDRWQQQPDMYEAFIEEIQDFRYRWKVLIREGDGMGCIPELKSLFGEVPVNIAYKKFAEARSGARPGGLLNMQTKSTAGSASTGHLSAVPAANSVNVRDHRFYGK